MSPYSHLKSIVMPASKLQNFRPPTCRVLTCTHYEPDYFKPDGYGPGEVEFLKSLLPKLVRTTEIVTVTGEAWERGSASTENVHLPHSEAGGWLYYVCNCLCWLSQLIIIQVYNSNHKIGSSTELLYHSSTDIYKSAFLDKICMGLGTLRVRIDPHWVWLARLTKYIKT